jgi:hypothetical protein
MTDTTDARARRRIAAAIETNMQRDAIERAHEFAPPGECSPEAQLRTVLSALWAGLVLEDWTIVAEGAVLLAELAQFRPWIEEQP